MKPEVGQWYECDEIGEFQVLRVDRDSDEIEIETRNGSVESWDIDMWKEFDEAEELTKLEEDPMIPMDDEDGDCEIFGFGDEE